MSGAPAVQVAGCAAADTAFPEIPEHGRENAYVSTKATTCAASWGAAATMLTLSVSVAVQKPHVCAGTDAILEPMQPSTVVFALRAGEAASHFAIHQESCSVALWALTIATPTIPTAPAESSVTMDQAQARVVPNPMAET